MTEHQELVALRIVYKKMRGALEEIKWLFAGESDIDNNGYPNRAMKINSIVDQSITLEIPKPTNLMAVGENTKSAEELAIDTLEKAYESIQESDELTTVTHRGLLEAIANSIRQARSESMPSEFTDKTPEYIEKFISYAEAEAGHECCEEWFKNCCQLLRGSVAIKTEHKREDKTRRILEAAEKMAEALSFAADEIIWKCDTYIIDKKTAQDSYNSSTEALSAYREAVK